MGLFGSILHSCGSQALTHVLSLPPMGEIRTKKGSLGTQLCHLWGGVTQIQSVFLLPYPVTPMPDFLFFGSNSVLELLHWTPGLLQKLSPPHVVV